jgi:macrolide-specific efflux system membrane fusion protein
MTRKGRILAINGVLVLVLGGALFGAYELLWPSPESNAASDARHMSVLRANVIESVSAAGTLQSGYTATADFATSGTVTEIDVKVGDVVGAGAVLAKLDGTEAEQQVKAAQSSLDAAEEDLANAKEAAATTTSAPPPGGQSGGGAQQQSITSLQAKVDQAALALQQAKDARSATVLTAPGAGTVTAITGSVGQKVGSSAGSSSTAKGSTGTGATTTSGFITITDLGNLVVKANVAEIDVSKVKAGQDATVTINALPDTPIAGKVISADLTPTTTNNIVQFGVSLSLTQPPAGLRPGQSASVSITVARADDALAVPSAAVRTVGGTSTVTVLTNGQEESRTIQVGVRSESLVQVTSGLSDGDQVVLALPSTTGTGNTGGFGGGGGRQGGGGLGGGGGGGGGGAVIPGGGTGR